MVMMQIGRLEKRIEQEILALSKQTRLHVWKDSYITDSQRQALASRVLGRETAHQQLDAGVIWSYLLVCHNDPSFDSSLDYGDRIWEVMAF